MVLTYEEEKALETLKHEQRMSFEKLRHGHKVIELDKELEIAKVSMGEVIKEGDEEYASE